MLTGALAVETGGTVRFRYTVENTGEDPVELTFRDGGQADCAVFEDDEEVWRWSAGRMFTQAIAHETLAPGDTREFGFEWETTDTGTYTARAELRAQEETCVTETSFSVE